MNEVIRVADQYYILATAAHDERARVLQHGDTFALFDRAGNIRALGLQDQGLYHQGTRFLSRLELRVNGVRPLLLSSSVLENNALLAVDLTNPDLHPEGEIAIPHGTIHVFRSKFLDDSTCRERLRIHNYGDTEVVLELHLEMDADFRDIFEVRGTRRERRGAPPRCTVEGDELLFVYEGLDGVRRTTRIHAEPRPSRVAPHELRFQARIPPRSEQVYYLDFECSVGDDAPQGLTYDAALSAKVAQLSEFDRAECRIHTSNEMFDEWLSRSISDLRMLISRTDLGPYPYAGVPWYATPFGRDGILTALQVLWFNPEVARGVLRFLAATQAKQLEPERDAEPGKILHEMRRGEMAALGEIPFGRYYGTVDATPLFVMLAGEYFRATADRPLIEELWPSIELAQAWIDQYGDADRDGFVEYSRRASKGLRNQGWKDSWDSVFHADRRLAEGPIALCEVQGYTYAAKCSGAALAAVLGRDEQAQRWRSEAGALRARFEDAFWSEELSMYGLALDGEKRLCRVKTSNAGHCLFTGLASEERALRTARTLTSPEFFSGWGIRTVAESQVRYNPMSYHNGSIWPHDNALIAAGFARYGLKDEVVRVFEGMFEASLYFDLHRMPELFCGFVRRPQEGPTLYPVACSPQAWASGALMMLLQACLGFELDAARGQLRFLHPALPSFLDEVRIEGLRVGRSVVDLLFHRYPDGASVNVTRRKGTVQVSIVK